MNFARSIFAIFALAAAAATSGQAQSSSTMSHASMSGMKTDRADMNTMMSCKRMSNTAMMKSKRCSDMMKKYAGMMKMSSRDMNKMSSCMKMSNKTIQCRPSAHTAGFAGSAAKRWAGFCFVAPQPRQQRSRRYRPDARHPDSESAAGWRHARWTDGSGRLRPGRSNRG